MPSFDSGVASYIVGSTVISNAFPIDFKGNADISCMQCKFFIRNNGTCQLTKSIVAYPQKFVGQDCPLEFEEKE